MEGFKSPQEKKTNNIRKGSGLGYAAALVGAALSGGPVSETVYSPYPTAEASTPNSETAPAALTAHERREIGEIETYLSKSAREEIETVEAALDVPVVDYEKERRIDDMNRQLVRETDPVHLAFKVKLEREAYEAKQAEAHNSNSSQDEDDSSRIKAALDAAKS